jgi:LCP family protein required for cell wall assembly
MPQQVTVIATRPLATLELPQPTAPLPIATDVVLPLPGSGLLPGVSPGHSETLAPLPSATPTPEFPVAGPTLTPTPVSLGALIPTPGLAPLATLPALGAAPVVPPAGDAFTMLLLGVDQRPDEPYNTRTDTVMIARIDPQNRRVALLSLPRDLVVNIPGYGFSRINAAHAYGGIPLVKQTVSQLLGIQVDYTATINFYGFIAMIDAIGGITIDVEKEIYDPAYPTMDYGYMVAHFLPGIQEMDGETALMYARTRHADSDWDRMQRQQEVIRAVVAKLRGQNAIEMLQQIEALTGVMRDHIRTDVPIERIIGVAWALRDLTPEEIETYRLDGSMLQMGLNPDDPNAGYALPGTIERLTRQLMGQ